MTAFVNFIKGIIIGIGAVAPGISGGSLAVIFGIYERITDFISNIFKDFKSNFLFFLPIAIGGGVGVIGFSKILNYFFEYYSTYVTYLFIGLIAGTLPSVFREANKNGYKRSYLIPFVLSFVLTAVLAFIDNNSQEIVRAAEHSFLEKVGFGAILGFGTIIPGISASFILMYLGAYKAVLDGISSINLYMLIPAGIGFVASILLFAKIINLLFKKFYGYTYYTAIGFVMGSIIPIFPGFKFSPEYLLCVLLSIGGFFLTYFLCNVKKPA